MVRDVLCDIVRRELAADTSRDAPQREIAVQYVVGGYVAVVMWWLRSGAKQGPDAVDTAFRAIATSGLRS
jgi:hypothetical protein